MRRMVWALLSMPAIAGCTANIQVADTLFVQPGKYNFLRCQDIAQRANGLTHREKELTSLMERADQSAAGPLVNAMVYAADLEQVRADLRLLQRTAREKNCDAPPTDPLPNTPTARR